MGNTISSQSTALNGQNAADALLRSDTAASSSSSQSTPPKKTPSASYELSLSDTAQALMGSKTPVTNNPTDAQKQLDLIKAAAQQSPATTLNLHTPNAKSVVDLLA